MKNKKPQLITKGFHLPYNPQNIERARTLRKNLTPAEKKLWYECLRHYPRRVTRQRPIDNYIVDFYCASLKLVIEVDGDSHFFGGAIEHDKHRAKILEGYGLKIIRFTNNEILQEFEGVMEMLFGLVDSKS